jgi:hypothetical protein
MDEAVRLPMPDVAADGAPRDCLCRDCLVRMAERMESVAG